MNHTKTIIITGAASGIGCHVAKTMIRRGYRVVLCDINIELLSHNFCDIDSQHVLLQKLDVVSVENWQTVIKQALQHFQKIDYLFNIAGIITPGFIHETPIEALSQQLDINTKGMMFGAKLVSEIMVKQGYGHIIHIASIAGIIPVSGIAGYSASKFAIRGFSLAIANDLKPYNVNVSVICPDLVNTPMLAHELNYEEEAALIFTGAKPLTVEDIGNAFIQLMAKPKLELTLPYSRGLVAKIGSFFPAFNAYIASKIKSKGKAQLKSYKSR